MVNSLTVTFSTVVTIRPGAFVLLDKTTGKRVDLEVATSQVGNRSKAVLTIPTIKARRSSLDDGPYLLTIYGNLIHGIDGQALDGDGNGTPGGNYVHAFSRLFRAATAPESSISPMAVTEYPPSNTREIRLPAERWCGDGDRPFNRDRIESGCLRCSRYGFATIRRNSRPRAPSRSGCFAHGPS